MPTNPTSTPLPPAHRAYQGGIGYRPKPPLWRPQLTKQPSVLAVAAGVLLVVIGVPLLVLLANGSYFGVPTGQVEVRVVRTGPALLPEDRHSPIRHVVALPDGSEQLLVSDRAYRPGERLLVTVSTNFFTRRTTLGAPLRLLSQATAEPSAAGSRP